MEKVRFFLLISFAEEDVLIDFFSLVNHYIGKYDYFTQNIKQGMGTYESQIHGRYSQIRVFSFRKLYTYNKLSFLLKKTELIHKKLLLKGYGNYNIMCGFVQPNQVVTIHRKYSPNSIIIKKNLCARIQMVFEKGKPVPSQSGFSEFSVSDVRSFFIDLYRIYRDQTGI